MSLGMINNGMNELRAFLSLFNLKPISSYGSIVKNVSERLSGALRGYYEYQLIKHPIKDHLDLGSSPLPYHSL